MVNSGARNRETALNRIRKLSSDDGPGMHRRAATTEHAERLLRASVADVQRWRGAMRAQSTRERVARRADLTSRSYASGAVHVVNRDSSASMD
jgi:hypothetical protein